MDVVVLGGGGLTGRAAVRDLAETGRFDTVRVADLDLGLARAAADAAGPRRARAEALDVRDPARLRAVLRGAAVCVNAVQYTHHLPVMEGCLAEGVPYLDFGGLFHTTRRQLEWDGRFRAAGLLAIPGMGQVPGASNILVRAATDDLERVERVVLRDGWIDLTPDAPEVYFPWSPATFLDEMEQPAMVLEEGELRSVPPLSGPESYEFAAPVGRVEIYRTLHSETATLPDLLRAKGLRHCEWKEGGPGLGLLRGLARIGLGSTEPIELAGQRVVPRELLLELLRRRQLLGAPPGAAIDDWEVLDVEIVGERAGRRVARHALARFPPKPAWHLTATEYAVGACGSVAATLVAEGAVPGAGVLPPERCVPPDRFRAALALRGIATAIAPDEGTLPPFPPDRGERGVPASGAKK